MLDKPNAGQNLTAYNKFLDCLNMLSVDNVQDMVDNRPAGDIARVIKDKCFDSKENKDHWGIPML